VRLAKLHGAGNDFLLADGRDDAGFENMLPGIVARLCDRCLGIGADGLLLLQPGGRSDARLVYWNSDGSPARFCANGTRCAARFAAVRWGLDRLVLHTGRGPVPAEVHGTSVTLDLAVPEEVIGAVELAVGGCTVAAWRLVVGVPHLVVPVDWPDFWAHGIEPLAPALRHHPALGSEGANVTFLLVAGSSLEARSFERGVEAETLSCGSGVVAAALVALSQGWAASPVDIRTASGRVLTVAAEGTPPLCPTRLTGPAEWVADVEISPELLGTTR
jgi:diaminopimelate epimerase